LRRADGDRRHDGRAGNPCSSYCHDFTLPEQIYTRMGAHDLTVMQSWNVISRPCRIAAAATRYRRSSRSRRNCGGYGVATLPGGTVAEALADKARRDRGSRQEPPRPAFS
jgi:hypothetical protein